MVSESGTIPWEAPAAFSALLTPILLQLLNRWLGQEKSASEKARFQSIERLVEIIEKIERTRPDSVDAAILDRHTRRLAILEESLNRKLKDLSDEIERSSSVRGYYFIPPPDGFWIGGLIILFFLSILSTILCLGVGLGNALSGSDDNNAIIGGFSFAVIFFVLAISLRWLMFFLFHKRIARRARLVDKHD